MAGARRSDLSIHGLLNCGGGFFHDLRRELELLRESIDAGLKREDAAAQVATNYLRFVEVYTAAE